MLAKKNLKIFEQLYTMMSDAEDVVQANRLHMITIACLTREELSFGTNKDLEDESEDENGLRCTMEETLPHYLTIFRICSSSFFTL